MPAIGALRDDVIDEPARNDFPSSDSDPRIFLPHDHRNCNGSPGMGGSALMNAESQQEVLG